MKGRKQKSSKERYRQNSGTESYGYGGAPTCVGMTENNLMEVSYTEEQLLEQILSPSNLNRAYKHVKSNGGAGGVDKMETEALLPYLLSKKEALLASLYTGTYRPNPVRRVEIPKDNGKKRQLGIPTVVDRLIQQAINQVLTPIYEKEFSSGSYGFRPGRSCHQALRKAQSYLNSGYKYAVDIDLERFFDTVNQSKLIVLLSKRIKDGRVVSLIHKYLRSGVQVGRKYEESEAGVPQGSPLSPLLGNIMLNELDKELEKRGHPFVRYADDGLIFCRSRRASARVKQSIIRFIEAKLFLRVNVEKTRSGYVCGMKFLGYSFYFGKGEYRLCLHPKTTARMKLRLKALTARSNGMGYAMRKQKLREYIVGWLGYFKLADMKNILKRTDEWLRRRIRMCIWKCWKRVKTRYKKLCQCGIDKVRALLYANARQGYWRMSSHPILNEAISTEKLRKAGYPFLLDYYSRLTS